MSRELTDVGPMMSLSPIAVVGRGICGAIVGWLIMSATASSAFPAWVGPAVAATLAIALAVAPAASRWAGQGVNSGWAFASAVGLYVGVPETDRIVGIVAVLAIVWLGELTGRMRIDGLMVAALDVLLVWAAVHGAAGRPGALVAGLATLGLLVVAPLVALAMRRNETVLTARWAPVLIAAQFVFTIIVARLGGVRTTAGEAITVVVVSSAALALATFAVFLLASSQPSPRRPA